MFTLSIPKSSFFIFFILYLIAGYYLAFNLQIYHNDAISRTANAFFTVFGRDPHLAAIGFVWQPLPSLLQIPLLLILRPFGLGMLAGPLVTSILGASSVAVIYKISELLNKDIHPVWSLLIAFLYGLNPAIFLYAAIGSSETIFISSLLFFSYFFIKWYLRHNQINLILSGFFLATAFGSRYESIPVFLACIVILACIEKLRKSSLSRIEGTVIEFCLPFIYTVSMWIFANWLIKGDPFYFMNSVYSNGSFTAVLKTNPQAMEYSYHSIGGSILYVLKRTLLVAPIMVALPFVLFLLGKKFKNDKKDIFTFIILTIPYFSILAFHAFQLFKGDSLGWLRFYIYATVGGTLMAIYLVGKHRVLKFIMVLFLIIGMFTTSYALSQPNYGKEEVSFFEAIVYESKDLDFSRTYADQKRVSALMNSTKGKILLDTNKGFAIPLFANDPSRYVITSDIDYEKIVRKYSYVDWIIIEKPSPEGGLLNQIYKYYPRIWDGNAPSLTLYKQIDNWRIFKVEKPSL